MNGEQRRHWNKAYTTAKLKELENQIGRPYDSFPDRCWGVVKEIYGEDVDGDCFDKVSWQQGRVVLPGDVVFLAGGMHCGVVATSGQHLMEAKPGPGLVCRRFQLTGNDIVKRYNSMSKNRAINRRKR